MHGENEIKDAVRARYAGHVTNATGCCSPKTQGIGAATGCCSPSTQELGSTSCGGPTAASAAERLGYSADDLAAIPEGADLGLGCGNPLALLGLSEGETVVDLGSGAGIDCFIAARRVGQSGRVIGVDMTPEMISRARANAEAADITNVEFRLGEIEHLPIGDGEADAVISNCVVNLVPNKRQVFAEVARVLKPGGRISLSDIVTLEPMPVKIRDSVDAYVSCLSGAVLRDEYLALIGEAGFTDVEVTDARGFNLDEFLANEMIERIGKKVGATTDDVVDAAKIFQSIRVSAVKPR